MVQIIFILPNGERREVAAEVGQNLMILAQKNGLDVEGACGGAMACSTCHMIVEPDWYGKLTPPTADETDMLDLARHVTRTSRLGCQIKVTEALAGLVLRLPEK